MPIKFPDFRDARCIAVGACGSLDTDEKETLEAIEKLKDQVLIASYRIGKTIAFIRVLFGGEKKRHIHIDAYRREAFGRRLPKVTNRRNHEDG